MIQDLKFAALSNCLLDRHLVQESWRVTLPDRLLTSRPIISEHCFQRVQFSEPVQYSLVEISRQHLTIFGSKRSGQTDSKTDSSL